MNQYLLEKLLQPECYPEPTSAVRHLQTHISHLFLTDQYVYKLKKPVDFGFLDFTTLERRRHFCHEELRLNRRLSPDIYLEVVALRDDGSGGLCFGGEGQLIEYAVKMRRLPEERMLDRLLAADQITAADIEAIARVVAAFHAAAATDQRIASFGSVAVIRANWLENLRQTLPYCGVTLSRADHQLIGDWALTTLDSAAACFDERVSAGFIRECDGDLHTENICLDGQVHIFDCIEFNEPFRYSDTAADVAFLAMDLENHGRRDLAELFVAAYCQESGDTGLLAVLSLYLVNRAFIRGKVESFRLDDPLIPTADKQAAAHRASRFFRLARGYLLRRRLPRCLLLTCGPTGCGKSSFAVELCFQLGIGHLQADRERKLLAGIRPTERGAAIYTADWNRATYERLAELAAAELAAGRSVVVDATFRSAADRARFGLLAAEAGVPLIICALVCPAEVVRQRLLDRQQSDDSVSDGTWPVYQRQIAIFEQPTDAEGQLLAIDATKPVTAMVEQALSGLALLL
ncbi:AAA family ATPase [Trichlorobacter sp.]|uniref:bifunctional aminoglycoside phosphotransferase/ATP-binding protein n=1 Tax=Trichlorobacter sp. TaxID=2911007 RepID=UPI002A36665D|nr:AAA family ATPase [Trichlorobacter sp.]MDY0384705.1 AAA family ATPase [Trichlorobacter sp.]